MMPSRQLTIFLGFICVAGMLQAQAPRSWVAPVETDALVNPVKNDALSIAEGKKLFISNCAACHGEKGKGDGVAAATLNPRPANFTSERVQKQSEGAIFWKITNGRPPMASYKGTLTDLQRWQITMFIKTLGRQK
jgi:mono/diheme cytochrome c family protein